MNRILELLRGAGLMDWLMLERDCLYQSKGDRRLCIIRMISSQSIPVLRRQLIYYNERIGGPVWEKRSRLGSECATIASANRKTGSTDICSRLKFHNIFYGYVHGFPRRTVYGPRL